MIPSLLTFTLLAGLFLLALGLPFLINPGRMETGTRSFPRHRLAGVVTMLLGGGWFLWKITQLGPSDFGDYKHLLFMLFAAVLIGSIFYVRDFLAVRGVSILVLLTANVGLKSAYGLYDTPARLVLVAILYLLIVAALVYGTMPYKARDTINWLYARPPRIRGVGLLCSAMGAVLLLSALLF